MLNGERSLTGSFAEYLRLKRVNSRPIHDNANAAFLFSRDMGVFVPGSNYSAVEVSTGSDTMPMSTLAGGIQTHTEHLSRPVQS